MYFIKKGIEIIIIFRLILEIVVIYALEMLNVMYLIKNVILNFMYTEPHIIWGENVISIVSRLIFHGHTEWILLY